MTTQSDVNSTYTSVENKLTAAGIRKTYRPYFYAGSLNYANINIDPDITQQLNLTPDTEIIEEIVTIDGQRCILIRRRFKETI